MQYQIYCTGGVFEERPRNTINYDIAMIICKGGPLYGTAMIICEGGPITVKGGIIRYDMAMIICKGCVKTVKGSFI